MRVALETSPLDRGGLLTSLVAGEGSATHAWLHSPELNASADATRNLSDMLHLLTMLHGPQPGLVELVADHNIWPGGDAWLAQAARGFANERGNLGQLIVAAGPVPGTPGEAATVSAILAQRQAMATIARSDRFGCAIGAVVGLLLDWQPIRATMETAAARLNVPFAPLLLPSEEETAHVLASMPEQPRLERTLIFGARQMMLHHQCLLDLLATRASARG
ncbi:hypothetical protein HL653_15075 [Sphingomonas sp. AP4-R1]|uniref:DUF6975 family protein n=1 Tax=Sphingomonas sp. AP4-R1 TaxID=2735134 RepID=UPI0014937270|nr:hypothetical protein [Sphingomonas sp. AP4-R1]QJU58917.1 hypothetical protein HL653_15075 [Sphingomonas sp. AP4-R1]